MKKIVAIVALFLVTMFALSGCAIGNHTFYDFKHTFQEAIIQLPDGTIVSGQVQEWHDYEDGDCVQIKIDGVVYLTHYTRATLIRHE